MRISKYGKSYASALEDPILYAANPVNEVKDYKGRLLDSFQDDTEYEHVGSKTQDCKKAIPTGAWNMDTDASSHLIEIPFYYSYDIFNRDGTLSRYKARLIVNDSTQVVGIDVDETFSLVVKAVLFRLFLVWLLLDIGRFINLMSRMPSYMRSFYGLKQAFRAWFQRFASYITRVSQIQEKKKRRDEHAKIISSTKNLMSGSSAEASQRRRNLITQASKT
ncbi:ribonuclease H-like domain-containing protein [Tanacetum coccineum]